MSLGNKEQDSLRSGRAAMATIVKQLPTCVTCVPSPWRFGENPVVNWRGLRSRPVLRFNPACIPPVRREGGLQFCCTARATIDSCVWFASFQDQFSPHCAGKPHATMCCRDIYRGNNVVTYTGQGRRHWAHRAQCKAATLHKSHLDRDHFRA